MISILKIDPKKLKNAPTISEFFKGKKLLGHF